MRKKLLLVAAVLLVLVVGAVFAVLASIDGLARKAIQTGGSYALGSSTTVSGVHVGLLSGQFSLSGLNVANPNGGAFKSDHFLSLGSGAMAVSVSTLRQPTVELPRLALDKLDINLEKEQGKTNYGSILDNLARVTGGDKPKPAGTTADDKKFIIRDLDIQNIVVHADLIGGPAALGSLTRVTVPIDRIKLKDVGQTGAGVGGTGVSLSELSAIIVKAVLAAAVDKGGGIIPADLLGDLKGKLAALGGIANMPAEVIAGTMGKVEEVSKKALDTVGGIAGEGKKALDDAADKLKGLIPGDKKKPK